MKTKIVFAGVMGAILMSVGANAATTLATKGYVDQRVGGVQTAVDNLQQTQISMQDVANAIGASLENGKIDLSGYQLTANMVTTALAEVAKADQGKKYPSVGAVLSAIDTKISALGLTPEQIESLKNLLGEGGVAASIRTLQGDVAGLKTQVGTGTVANQIADAIATHKTQADNTYQAKSTADLQIGTTGGVFRNMTDAEKAALASGITVGKVAGYDATKDTVDGLMGEGGAIKELQTVVGDASKGLVKDVAANKTAIETNTSAIATNAAAIATNKTDIAKRILTPTAECTGPESTCVLMIRSNNVVWTPVTEPVNDPVTGGTTDEAMGG